MQCQNCHNSVNVVTGVHIQTYDEEGNETAIKSGYWCLSCINNVDSEDNLGIPKIKEGK